MKPKASKRRSTIAKYLCTKATKDKLIFEPIQRLHVSPKNGTTTELLNVAIVLNDGTREVIGEVKVGDVREFEITQLPKPRSEKDNAF
jgi:hypothetical protein